MKYSVLFLTLLLINPLLLISQTGQKEKAYCRFEGNIGSNINITANLVRLFEKLSGNYQYRFLDEDAAMYYGKTIEIEGDISGNDSAQLREFRQKNYTFKGVMKDKTFNGTWYGPAGKTLPFEMKEYYPNGSMEFDVYYLNSEEELVRSDPKSPTANIELTLLYPNEKYFKPFVADSVKNIIVKSFFGTGIQPDNPDTLMVHFEKEYFDNYISQNKEWYGKGASFDWEKIKSMSVVFNSGYMLCLEFLTYAYTGGAHGMTNISYNIINLDDGQMLTFSNVFKEEATDSLSELLTRQLRKNYQIPGDVSLKDAGFFVEKVKPNHNIYIDGNGIGFLYNRYEIAPYSQGATHIVLDWPQIRGLLKNDTPVYKLSLR